MGSSRILLKDDCGNEIFFLNAAGRREVSWCVSGN